MPCEIRRRHRAHRTEVLRDDQIGRIGAQALLVDAVDLHSCPEPLRDLPVDLSAAPRRVYVAVCNARLRIGLRRVVTLVRHARDLLVEPEPEQYLGGTWEQ